MVRVTSAAWMYLAAIALATTAQQQYASAQSFKCHGVNYNIRAGPDWAPDTTKCKSAETIAAELVKLKTITDTIRLYSLTDCNQGTTVVPAAVKAGLKVSLGLWVGPEAATFEAEKTKFVELLAQDGLINAKDIVGIHVGSEAVYRGDVNTTVAISNFDEIKKLCTAKNLDIPVTIADIGDIYLQYPELIDAVDVVSANAFPFWEKIDADKAASYMYGRLEPLIELAAKQNKGVIIGETGWATDGVQEAASDATPENAATYFHDFYTLAQQHSLKYFYFAGFDEQWKIATLAANATVEAYFGLFKEGGDLKDEYKQLTLDLSSSSSSSSSSTSTEVGAVASGDSSSSSSADATIGSETSTTVSSSSVYGGASTSAVKTTTASSTAGSADCDTLFKSSTGSTSATSTGSGSVDCDTLFGSSTGTSTTVTSQDGSVDCTTLFDSSVSGTPSTSATGSVECDTLFKTGSSSSTAAATATTTTTSSTAPSTSTSDFSVLDGSSSGNAATAVSGSSAGASTSTVTSTTAAASAATSGSADVGAEADATTTTTIAAASSDGSVDCNTLFGSDVSSTTGSLDCNTLFGSDTSSPSATTMTTGSVDCDTLFGSSSTTGTSTSSSVGADADASTATATSAPASSGSSDCSTLFGSDASSAAGSLDCNTLFGSSLSSSLSGASASSTTLDTEVYGKVSTADY